MDSAVMRVAPIPCAPPASRRGLPSEKPSVWQSSDCTWHRTYAVGISIRWLPELGLLRAGTRSSSGSRLRGLRTHVAEYLLLQLRVHLVCDGSDVHQHLAEVHTAQIVLQRLENAELQDPRLLNHHGGSVALLAPQNSMLVRRSG